VVDAGGADIDAGGGIAVADAGGEAGGEAGGDGELNARVRTAMARAGELANRSRAVVVVVPPGGGKTDAMIETLKDAGPGGPVRLLSPYTKRSLAAFSKIAAKNGGLGPEFFASPVHDLPGRSICLKKQAVEAAQKLGLTAAAVCRLCEHQETCTAKETIGDEDLGTVATHMHASVFAGEAGLRFDEMPSILAAEICIPKQRAYTAVDAAVAIDFKGRDALLAWAAAIDAGRIDDPSRGLAREATKGRALPIPIGEQALLAGSEESDDEKPQGGQQDLASGLRRQLKTRRENARIAAAVARVSRVDADFADCGSYWHVLMLTDALYHWRMHGGIIASATPRLAALRNLRPDCDVIYVAAPDGRKITRIASKTWDLTTFKLKKPDGRARFAQATEDAFDLARREMPDLTNEETVIFCAQAFVAWAKALLPGARVAHFYGDESRGSNDFMGARAYLLIGDHFVNRDANSIESGYLGLDETAEWRETVANEKAQCCGRAREVRAAADGETLPEAVIVTKGTVMPAGWAERGIVNVPWQDAKRDDLDEKVAALRAEGKTWPEVAAATGKGLATVKRHGPQAA